MLVFSTNKTDRHDILKYCSKEGNISYKSRKKNEYRPKMGRKKAFLN
jgi:hypothetical protein